MAGDIAQVLNLMGGAGNLAGQGVSLVTALQNLANYYQMQADPTFSAIQNYYRQQAAQGSPYIDPMSDFGGGQNYGQFATNTLMDMMGANPVNPAISMLGQTANMQRPGMESFQSMFSGNPTGGGAYQQQPMNMPNAQVPTPQGNQNIRPGGTGMGLEGGRMREPGSLALPTAQPTGMDDRFGNFMNLMNQYQDMSRPPDTYADNPPGGGGAPQPGGTPGYSPPSGGGGRGGFTQKQAPAGPQGPQGPQPSPQQAIQNTLQGQGSAMGVQRAINAQGGAQGAQQQPNRPTPLQGGSGAVQATTAPQTGGPSLNDMRSNQLQQMFQQGGSMGPGVQQNIFQSIADRQANDLVSQQRAAKERAGATGLGQSGILEDQLFRSNLAANQNMANARRDIGTTAAMQNWQDMSGLTNQALQHQLGLGGAAMDYANMQQGMFGQDRQFQTGLANNIASLGQQGQAQNAALLEALGGQVGQGQAFDRGLLDRIWSQAMNMYAGPTVGSISQLPMQMPQQGGGGGGSDYLGALSGLANTGMNAYALFGGGGSGGNVNIPVGSGWAPLAG